MSAHFGPNSAAVEQIIDELRSLAEQAVDVRSMLPPTLEEKAFGVLTHQPVEPTDEPSGQLEASQAAVQNGFSAEMNEALRHAWEAAPALMPDPLEEDSFGVGYQNLIENAIYATATRGFISDEVYERLIAPWRFFHGRAPA